MTDPIITPIAASIGVGGWFAGKVLGPSADALGHNLQAYLAIRIPAIFARAAEIAKSNQIEPMAIKPGLLARMVIDASFSDDSEDVTEWWANIFVDASNHGDNLHATFSDSMALLGPKEAKCLQDFYEYVSPRWGDYVEGGKTDPIVLSGVVYDEIVRRFESLLPLDEDQWHEVSVLIATANIPLPVRVYAWSLPVKYDENRSKFPVSSEVWYSENRLSFEVLQRAGLVRLVRIPVGLMSSNSAWIDVLELTAIGHEFCAACHGERFKK